MNGTASVPRPRTAPDRRIVVELAAEPPSAPSTAVVPVHSCESAETWVGDGADEDVRLRAGCFACQADRARARAISRWEDRPLDPEDDLALLWEYPELIPGLRAEQEEIRRLPVYRLAHLIGGKVRAGMLHAIACGTSDEYYDQALCQCTGYELEDALGRGRGPQGRRRAAERCRWCTLRGRLEWTAHVEDVSRWSDRPFAEVEAEVSAADSLYLRGVA